MDDGASERGDRGRGNPWRERQRRVLTALRLASKRNRSTVAAAAGLEYWQLVRLETGKSELPAKLLPVLAAAYGVAPGDLIERLALNVAPSPWSPRAEMEASGVVPPHRVDMVEADCRSLPESAQQARVDGEIQLQRDLAAKVQRTTPPARPRTPSRRRAV